MTCIVGLVQNEKVYIGSDSAMSSSDDGLVSIVKTAKIVKKGNYIIGSSGSVRFNNLIHDELDRDKTFKTINELIEELFKILDRNSTSFMGDFRQCNGILVGLNGNLYKLHPDYGYNLFADGFTAIGSGSQVAIGVLNSLKEIESYTNIESQERINIALNSAAKYIGSVSEPFTFESI